MLTRQSLPALDRPTDFKPTDIWQGGYIVSSEEKDTPLSATLVATGSEVALAVETAQALKQEGLTLRVVSMPSVNLFLRQSKEYQNSVIPPNVPTISLEAGSTGPWAQITGRQGLNLGIDRFGASAPIDELADHFGFTSKAVCKRIIDFLNS
jgi:transketolase